MSEIGVEPSPATARGRFGEMNVLRGALFGGAALLLLVAGGAIALVGEHVLVGGNENNEVRVMTFQDWRVVCPPASQKDAQCSLSEDVVRDQGGTLVSLSMNDPKPDGMMTVTVPHGVLLDPGLGFSVGNDPMRVRPYETCLQAGCIAVVTVDADTLKSMRSNKNGQVVVVPGNGSPVTIPFSLGGFSDGYAALQKEKERRTSVWGFFGH